MASLIGEITGESVETVIGKLREETRHPGITVTRDFARSGGLPYEWGPELEAFYSKTTAFLYELAVWNRNHAKSGMRKWVLSHVATINRPLDILGVGDGLGFDCVALARKHHRVTYFELPGPSEQFARKLFERTGLDIAVLTDLSAIPKSAYDAIICFDVLEHVPDPPAVVRSLASYLRPGGLLYVSAPFYMILPRYPTHLRSNRKFSGSLKLFREAGLKLVAGRMSWYPLVFHKASHRVDAEGVATAMESAVTGGPLRPRWSAGLQAVGRVAAWPFWLVHLWRWAANRAM